MRRRALLAALGIATSLLAGCQTLDADETASPSESLSDTCANPERVTEDQAAYAQSIDWARVINGDDIEHTVCVTLTRHSDDGETIVHQQGYTISPAASVIVHEFTTPGEYTLTVELGDLTRQDSINFSPESLNDEKGFGLQFKITDDGTLTNASGGDG